MERTSDSVNPYKILGVSKNYTLEELRNNYKRIALQVHPDKGGSNELFQLVTQCYKRLLKHYEKKMEKDFMELKNEFKQFETEKRSGNADLATMYEQERSRQPPPAMERPRGGVDNRNQGEFMTAFNRIFEENRLDDAMAVGYGHTMAASSAAREDINIPNKMKTFKLNNFNKAFDKQAVNDGNKEIMQYKPPEPTLMAKRVGFSELGINEVDDFSGANDTIKKVNYMDYMKAHTTSKLIDPKLVKSRQDFKSMKELETHRSQNTTMNDNEWKEYNDAVEHQKALDMRRQQHQMEQDRIYESHHARMNQHMLQYMRN